MPATRITTITTTESEPAALPEDLQQLRLWQLISPTLPIGAFAYSQAQEHAVESGWITDEASARLWIESLLNELLTVTDVPILARCHRAARMRDLDTLRQWNDTLLAMRESSELQQEDLHLGGALVRVMPSLGLDWPEELHSMRTGYAAAFAWACAQWAVDDATAARALLWTWCENQVAAAIKLVPLGQSAGQRVLNELGAAIPRCVERGLNVADDDIGMTAPGFAMASAWHETQYSRLFRS